jgi:hypothetical protein
MKKEAEKILKYKDLTIEIQRMWNVKTKVMHKGDGDDDIVVTPRCTSKDRFKSSLPA